MDFPDAFDPAQMFPNQRLIGAHVPHNDPQHEVEFPTDMVALHDLWNLGYLCSKLLNRPLLM